MPLKPIPPEILKDCPTYDNCLMYEFPARISMPPGYMVVWSDSLEHYLAIGPNENGPYEWESSITWDKWQARRFAICHNETKKGDS